MPAGLTPTKSRRNPDSKYDRIKFDLVMDDNLRFFKNREANEKVIALLREHHPGGFPSMSIEPASEAAARMYSDRLLRAAGAR